MASSTEAGRRVKEMLREWDTLSEVLTTAIAYRPGGWGDVVPGELRQEVIREPPDR